MITAKQAYNSTKSYYEEKWKYNRLRSMIKEKIVNATKEGEYSINNLSIEDIEEKNFLIKILENNGYFVEVTKQPWGDNGEDVFVFYISWKDQ